METKLKKLLFSEEYWNLYLINEQSYLGRARLELKTPKQSLSELEDYEWVSFGKAVGKYEHLLKETFSAEMFNWTCMMNNAYSEESEEKPHVHFHVRPRYDKSINFSNMLFRDPTFGDYYDRSRKNFVDEDVFKNIFEELKNRLSK